MKRFSFDRQNVIVSGALIFVTMALVIVSDGNVGAALAPVAALVVLFAFIFLPLRTTATFFFTVALLFHKPDSYWPAMNDSFKGPLYLIGRVLWENLNALTGIGGLSFNLVEVALLLMLFLMGIRTLMRNNIDRHMDLPAAFPMKVAAIVSLLGIIFAIAWGKARGGADSGEMLWQVRARIFVPIILIICMRAFKTEQDIRRLGVALAIVCSVRILEGAIFLYLVAMPQGLKVHCAMSHNDTIWFSALTVVLIITMLENFNSKSVMRLLTLGGWTMFGIIFNDRRIAFVSLAFSIMAITFLIRIKVRRILIRIILVGLPVIIVYVAIGMNSDSAIFAPVRNLTSVSDNSDASNWCRNVENHDLIETLRTNPVLGIGWGHGYNDILTEVEFTTFAYRFHPHNSMLGLLTYSGIIGYYLTWLLLPVGVFLAYRAYRRSTTLVQRVGCLAAICVVIIYMVQAYGDMGAKDMKTAIVLSTALGSVSNLYMRTHNKAMRSS